MLQISKRGQEMPPSPIRKLVPYAEAAVEKGTKVYHLNIGQPDIETPQLMLDAVRNSDFKILDYGHSAGNESYRRKLVKYYKSVGVEVDYKQILITTGGSEALLFAFMACFDPGDEIIIPEPFYANYHGFAAEAGVEVVTITSDIATGFALPPVEEIEKKITARTRGIVICNPNNPTGYVYSKEELEQLATMVAKHNLYFFCDEAYREFNYEGEMPMSSLNLKGVDDNVVMVDTISKRYSACGGRIGALVTRNKLLIDTVMKFAQARLCPPSFAQMAGEAALDLPADYFDQTKAEYKSRRDLIVERLNAMEGVYCPKPSGAFYAIAELPIDDANKFCQWLLESFSYKGATVMLAPGSGFYATPGLGLNQVRLAYVLNKTDINAAMDCLQEALKVYSAD